MIRVLIADDSAFMRKVLSDLFSSRPDFQVVGTAINGQDAVQKVAALKPDVLTLDINMPVMNGLEALKIIMENTPLPVVMLSSLTKSGTEETIKALELGAVEFVNKPDGSISKINDIADEIVEKCHAAIRANMRSVTRDISYKNSLNEHEPLHLSLFNHRDKLVVIGTSTGGPKALQSVITKLPASLPCGVLVVQHMPAGFTKSLANRLDELSAIHVKEAEQGEEIKPGWVYIAPGNYHMRVLNSLKGKVISLGQDPPIGNHRPSVNALFESVAPFGRSIVAVIMTGMGCDGSIGMKKISDAHGYVIAEDKSTCVVYGMPKAVVDMGIADEVLPVNRIADAIVEAVKRIY